MALAGTGIVIRLIPVTIWYGMLGGLVLLFFLVLFLTR